MYDSGSARYLTVPFSGWAVADSHFCVYEASRSVTAPDASVAIWFTLNRPYTSLQPRPLPPTSRPGERPVRNAARSASR